MVHPRMSGTLRRSVGERHQLFGIMRDYWIDANEIEKARQSQWAIVEVSRFEESAYCAYKQMFLNEDWQLEKPRVLTRIQQTDVSRHRQYIMFGLEEEVEHLIRIQNGGSSYYELKRFEKLLFEADPEWLFEKYNQCLIQEAANTSNRKQYKQVTSLMKAVAKLKGGKEHMSELAILLKKEYGRRPAFVDELSKMNL